MRKVVLALCAILLVGTSVAARAESFDEWFNKPCTNVGHGFCDTGGGMSYFTPTSDKVCDNYGGYMKNRVKQWKKLFPDKVKRYTNSVGHVYSVAKHGFGPPYKCKFVILYDLK